VVKAVSIAYSRIFSPLRDQVFFSLAALNHAIGDLLQVYNDKDLQERPWSRRPLFDKEEKHLFAPLAPERFELSTMKNITVMENDFVQIYEDKHYYSVPYRFIGREVKVIYSASHVSIYYINLKFISSTSLTLFGRGSELDAQRVPHRSKPGLLCAIKRCPMSRSIHITISTVKNSHKRRSTGNVLALDLTLMSAEVKVTS